MIIENAIYVYNDITNQKVSINVTIDGISMCVPIDEGNRHYQAIQEWIAEGNTVIDNPPQENN